MGATGSRLVSGGMKPPASTFPAAPFSFDTRAARMSGHAYAGCAPVLWAGASTQVAGVRLTCRGLLMHSCGFTA